MNKQFIDKQIKKITKNNCKDLYQIARDNNIFILETNLGKSGGSYFYKMKTKTILLNSAFSYYHKLIVLAHEIAHATIHPYEEAHFTSIGYRTNTKENEANYFACKLLDIIGFWENESLCIYDNELNKLDKGVIDMYKNYFNEI